MATRKKTSRRKRTQRLYKMRGCNKKGCNKKTKRRYLGGSNMNLAYPSNNVPTVPNPHLAYLGNKTDAAAYPNPGPPSGGFNFLNPQNLIKGGGSQNGGCNCGLIGGMKGGCGPMCAAPLLLAGGQGMKGGYGNNGIPYPNGLAGSPWTPAIGGWPGVGGVDGNNNYLALNKLLVDPQTAMVATGAQRPFTGGKKKKQKGGTLSNLLSQDLINLGRQFQHGIGSAYNGISGYSSPVNPMPWKGQLPNTSSLSSVKALYI